MTYFLLGLILFFGIHLLRVIAPGVRQSIADATGTHGYRVFHAVVALVSLVLLIYGFGQARQETSILYVPPVYLAHLTLLLMLIAFIVLISAFLPTGYIALYAKHPMVLAIKIWAFAHLLANGETVQVILFASFLAWGVIMRIFYKRQEKAGLATPRTYKSWINDVVAVVAGLLLYGAFVMELHEWLIGVTVLPG
jgi:uncharacterized membrane protein